jgi:hypothetical protein
MSGRLEPEERIYRSFPAPLINLLKRTKGVGQPTAVVESVEVSTGIPRFEDEEFRQLMDDLNDDASDATRKLEKLAAKHEKGNNGNGDASAREH